MLRAFTSLNYAVLVLAVCSWWACGGDPTDQIAQALSLSCASVVNGYQCSASVPAPSERDVSGLASWSTAAPASLP